MIDGSPGLNGLQDLIFWAVRLYAPHGVVEHADAAWSAMHHRGSFPDVQRLRTFEADVIAALDAPRSEARASAGVA